MRKTLKGEGFEITIPKQEPTTMIDEAIRAHDEGDGAAIFAMHEEIGGWLKELRRYREAIRCMKCDATVLGRSPVCRGCVEDTIRERLRAEFSQFVGEKYDPARALEIESALRRLLS